MKKIFFSTISILGFQILLAQVNSSTPITILDVWTNDLVYDQVTDKLYASIPSNNGSNGNSLGIINLEDYILENTVYIGSEPNALAVSDDGQFIYATLKGAPMVSQYIVDAQQLGIQFTVGDSNFVGPLYPYDIEVMPNNPNTVAVSRIAQSSSGFYGTAIFDSGVIRDINTSSIYPNNYSYVINFLNDSVLYGYNNHSTGFDFNGAKIDSSGIYQFCNVGNIIQGFSMREMEIVDNRVYFDYGGVVDVSNNEDPYLAGTFLEAGGRVAYDDSYHLVCFAMNAMWSEDIYFKRYSPDNFLLVDSLKIENVIGEVLDLEYCGNGTYAFNTDEGKLVIINGGEPGTLSVSSEIEPEDVLINNPVADWLFLKQNEGTTLSQLEIYNLQGQKVKEISINGLYKVDIRDLPSGTYFLKFYSDNNEYIPKRMVKQ